MIGTNNVDDDTPRFRGTMPTRVLVVVASFALAGVATVLTRRHVPALSSDVASVCVIWVALYPITLLSPRMKWWEHWVRGAIVVLGFWFATHVLFHS